MQKRRMPATLAEGRVDALDEQARQVVVPPVDDLSHKIDDALAQELTVTPCRYGCYCEPCLNGMCSDHVDSPGGGFISKDEYLARARNR